MAAAALPKAVFALDVESLGLYGAGFAVGVTVRDEANRELDSLYAACPLTTALRESRDVTPRDVIYLEQNVLPHLPPCTTKSLRGVRDAFFAFYSKWKASKDYDVIYVADCGAPVEARFLADVARDDIPARAFFMPFPLHEVGTLLFLCGKDPRANYPRIAGEEQTHNPLHDARHSARLWLEHHRELSVARQPSE